AATENDAFLDAALEWARELGATSVLFEDSARRRWPQQTIHYSCGWAAMNAEATSHGREMVRAHERGHAAVIDAGPQHHLAKAAPLGPAAGRSRRAPPPTLISAATLWRRLDELSVPLSNYDATCPRWHAPTLSERLDDLAGVRAGDFPA